MGQSGGKAFGGKTKDALSSRESLQRSRESFRAANEAHQLHDMKYFLEIVDLGMRSLLGKIGSLQGEQVPGEDIRSEFQKGAKEIIGKLPPTMSNEARLNLVSRGLNVNLRNPLHAIFFMAVLVSIIPVVGGAIIMKAMRMR